MVSRLLFSLLINFANSVQVIMMLLATYVHLIFIRFSVNGFRVGFVGYAGSEKKINEEE